MTRCWSRAGAVTAIDRAVAPLPAKPRVPPALLGGAGGMWELLDVGAEHLGSPGPRAQRPSWPQAAAAWRCLAGARSCRVPRFVNSWPQRDVGSAKSNNYRSRPSLLKYHLPEFQIFD